MLRAILNYFKPKPTPFLNAVYVKDEESGGYTTYFREYPAVVSQGKTKREALANLHLDFIAALEMQQRYSQHKGQTGKKQFA